MRFKLIAALVAVAATLGARSLFALQDGGDEGDPAPITIECESVVPEVFLSGCWMSGPYPTKGAALTALMDGTVLDEAALQAAYSQYRCADCPDGAPPCPFRVVYTDDMGGTGSVVQIAWWWFVWFCFEDPSVVEFECGKC